MPAPTERLHTCIASHCIALTCILCANHCRRGALPSPQIESAYHKRPYQSQSLPSPRHLLGIRVAKAHQQARSETPAQDTDISVLNRVHLLARMRGYVTSCPNSFKTFSASCWLCPMLLSSIHLEALFQIISLPPLVCFIIPSQTFSLSQLPQHYCALILCPSA